MLLSQGTISNMRHGRVPESMDVVRAFALAVGQDPDQWEIKARLYATELELRDRHKISEASLRKILQDIEEEEEKHRCFPELLERKGLRHIRYHDLRHSHGTYLAMMGVPAKVIQQRLGHSTITTTMDIYGHVLPEMGKDASDKIGKLFG